MWLPEEIIAASGYINRNSFQNEGGGDSTSPTTISSSPRNKNLSWKSHCKESRYMEFIQSPLCGQDREGTLTQKTPGGLGIFLIFGEQRHQRDSTPSSRGITQECGMLKDDTGEGLVWGHGKLCPCSSSELARRRGLAASWLSSEAGGRE